MYKHYFKTEDSTLMTMLTTDSSKDQHVRIGNTGTDEKETQFVLPVTRAPAFSDEDNEMRTRRRVFSRND